MSEKKGNILIITLSIFAILGITAAGYLYWQNNNIDRMAPPSNTPNPPLSVPLIWEACIKYPAATISLSHPGTCNLPDGRSVTQPLSDEEKKKLQLPDETANWKTYTSKEYGFEFKYPKEYFTQEKGLPVSSYSTPLIKISNSRQFSDDEFALVIEAGVENPKFGSSPTTRTIENNPPLMKLSVTELEQRLKTKIYGSFFGNPPWGVYELEIPLPAKEELYLKISARTHSSDEAERNSRDLKVFDQVLATLRFIN